MSRYAVPFVRGPEIKLPPHTGSCALDEVKDLASKLQGPLAIDLFSGAGGLSYGLHLAGFQVILAAEIEREAADTHRAHFAGATICVDLSDQSVLDQICEALEGVELDLVAGGPPCQPYSQAAFSKVRHLEAFHGRVKDSRRTLWSSYMEVVRRTRPKAVLVENVPDMAFGRDGIVLRSLVDDLEELGYEVHSRVLASNFFGVPQHRQRLFTVAFREPRKFDWPCGNDFERRILADAISDLPEVEGGDKQEVRRYEAEPTPLQRYFRESVPLDDANVVFDHHTRAVRPDDLEAFKLMTSRTTYRDLPANLKRYRDDIFEDKYKRLDMQELSRTITAHISQDGYWYIHPTQHRTLTIREAARVQTFPDDYRFCGYPRHAFKQIGEAVPPLFGKAVGISILRALQSTYRPREIFATRATAKAIADWFDTLPPPSLAMPWLRADNLWSKVLGQILFDRTAPSLVRREFDVTVQRWASPEALLRDSDADSFAETRFRFDQYQCLRALASAFEQGQPLSPDLLADCNVPSTVGLRILAVTGTGTRRPLNAALERLVRRFTGIPQLPEDGRGNAEMLLGRLVGEDIDGRAFSALNELTATLCTVQRPKCEACPLQACCANATLRNEEPHLFAESSTGVLAEAR